MKNQQSNLAGCFLPTITLYINPKNDQTTRPLSLTGHFHQLERELVARPANVSRPRHLLIALLRLIGQ